ncbi:MAG: 30S ribosomal protein S16 [Candidatus Pacebacteria bacterium CG10_big_fil_rev_8_21_14_0_10_36_11]|nr:30S ribosomal protein S16 [Candidatus Pacearchaeota archaeon]OIP74097.1 MAG: 30S ribosomal protein S16 [Candidatus Pacebacteria bacterium CG2_30_36_39]PIR64464.1 MAG: 30S ribosomal protein S16 [Candidatus Pacebacteria bacterium CG10_big_fil_rev_8_21_14_0_10_36_11]PJC42715.1 MAG: 30S ribosomal protein S16 [Candidatus Pacebacteria bacterium CG_4_9_14_0_2_um_filter_36_8]
MLKIKLARFGKTKQPQYRIVVNEAKDKRDGKYVEQVGRYVPAQIPKILEFEVEKYNEWLKKGAQPTETVASLFTRYTSGNPFPARKPQLSRKAKAKAEAAAKEAEEKKNAPVETVETTAAPEAPVETPVETVAATE